MKIKVKIDPKGEAKTMNIDAGSTMLHLIKMLDKEIKYPVVYAKMNNSMVELTTPILENSTVELLDIRTQAANLIYQNSLCLIYLRAVDVVFPGAKVIIDNAINKGLYTEIDLDHKITQREINKISKEMQRLIDLDLPFNKETLTRETAIEYFKESGLESRLKLLESNPNVTKMHLFSLDGYKDFFYSRMAISTGYIKYFELKKYKRGVLLRFPHPGNPVEIPEYVDEAKLFEAFEQQREWDGLLGIDYVEDLNEKIDAGELMDLVQLSEALHEKKVAQVADLITRENKRIVLIAGPSSSGKTTFARRLCIQLRVNGIRPIYLGTDDYFVNRVDTPLDANGEKDYENLNALDLKLFNRNMKDLIAGKVVDMPIYDFIKGEKIFGQKMTQLAEDQILVIEGIHALNEKLTEMIPHEQKYKIYISPLTQLGIDEHNRISTTDERMLRRLVRDYQFRGYSAKETIKNWPKVRAGEDKNIFPYSGEADILFNSYHVYEIAVLKKYADPLLAEITREDEEYADASRMRQFLQFFHVAEDDSMIVNNSIIREFIGGSIFV